MTVQLGIFLALALRARHEPGLPLKHRGACAAAGRRLAPPAAQRRRAVPLEVVRASACSSRSARGSSTSAAMALAPLSLVQAVISGGLVFLTVLAERFFGFSVGRRQWIGRRPHRPRPGAARRHAAPAPAARTRATRLAAMVAFEAGLLARRRCCWCSRTSSAPRTSTTACCSAPRRASSSASPTSPSRRSPADRRPTACSGCCRPGSLTCVAASVIAFFASARGLQKGEAVPVITLTSAARQRLAPSPAASSSSATRWPATRSGIVAPELAFVLVIVAAALTPAPLRARLARARPRSAAPAGRPGTRRC